MNSTTLTLIFTSIGHALMHMFAAFYFVIVLAIEDEWNITYDELIRLWTLGALLVGLGAIPAGWLSDRWSRSGMMVIMFFGLGFSSIFCGMSEDKLFTNLKYYCDMYIKKIDDKFDDALKKSLHFLKNKAKTFGSFFTGSR